jgi:hypothetical protein
VCARGGLGCPFIGAGATEEVCECRLGGRAGELRHDVQRPRRGGGSGRERGLEWEHVPKQLGVRGANDGIGVGRADIQQVVGGPNAEAPRGNAVRCAGACARTLARRPRLKSKCTLLNV